MTTLTTPPRHRSRHDASFTVEPDDVRAAGIARALRSRTLRSPYAMTRARAEKARALYEANFAYSPDAGGFTHPKSTRVFTLAEAVMAAEVMG
jgi:hypothetical protein